MFPESKIRSFEVCNHAESCLNRLIFNNSLAVATFRRHLESLSIRKDIVCLETSQSIHSYLKTFLIRSDFKMKDSFNDAMTEIMEAGLIAKWEKDFRFKREIDNNTEIRPVDIGDLLGTIFLCGVFIVLAIFVAVIEQISIWRNFKKIWQWVGLLIDGDRHFLKDYRKQTDRNML